MSRTHRRAHLDAAPALTKAVRGRIHTGHVDNTDLNQTLIIAVVLLASVTRLIQLLFASLRVCVREYYEFRLWLRAIARDVRRIEKDTAD